MFSYLFDSELNSAELAHILSPSQYWSAAMSDDWEIEGYDEGLAEQIMGNLNDSHYWRIRNKRTGEIKRVHGSEEEIGQKIADGDFDD